MFMNSRGLHTKNNVWKQKKTESYDEKIVNFAIVGFTSYQLSLGESSLDIEDSSEY